jgi:hypothetical protein
MKSFMMFRCGHKFHKNCYIEKLLINKEMLEAKGITTGPEVRQTEDID